MLYFQEENITYLLDGGEIEVKSCGVKASIIDFTLSRLSKGIDVHVIYYFLRLGIQHPNKVQYCFVNQAEN